MTRSRPGDVKDRGRYRQRAEESNPGNLGQRNHREFSTAEASHVRKDENEPPAGAGGSHERLLRKLQVHMKPISHAKEPGLLPVSGGDPTAGF